MCGGKAIAERGAMAGLMETLAAWREGLAEAYEERKVQVRMVGALLAALFAGYSAFAERLSAVPGWEKMGLAVVILLAANMVLLAMLLQAVMQFSKAVQDSQWSIEAACNYMKDKFSVVERRIEALVQAGRETQRHICSMYDSYSLEGGRCQVRWVCRMIIEEYCLWESARARLHECGTMKAFAVLCRAAREQCVKTLKLDSRAAVEWCRALLENLHSRVIKGCTQVHRGAYQPPAPPGGRAFK